MQHLSNGPIDLDVSTHEEQMEEMQFLLDKRTKEVERVIKHDLLIKLLLDIVSLGEWEDLLWVKSLRFWESGRNISVLQYI